MTSRLTWSYLPRSLQLDGLEVGTPLPWTLNGAWYKPYIQGKFPLRGVVDSVCNFTNCISRLVELSEAADYSTANRPPRPSYLLYTWYRLGWRRLATACHSLLEVQ